MTMGKKAKGNIHLLRNLDKGYKEMISCFFEDAITLVRPKAAEQILWDEPYEILDTECRYQIGSTVKTFVLDSLIRVIQRSGPRLAASIGRFSSEAIINNEFVAQQSQEVVPQVLGYRYAAIGRFGVEPYQILWLTDPSESWLLTEKDFYQTLLDLECHRPIIIVKVMSYLPKLDQLFAGQNVAGWTIWMTIRSHQTVRNLSQRFEYKIQMFDRLINVSESGTMESRKFRSVLSIMDSILTLPNTERKKYEDHMNNTFKIKGKYEPLLTDFEKRAMAKGKKEGIKEGKKEGEAKGKKEGEAKGKKEGIKEGEASGLRDSLRRILKLRFQEEGQAVYEQFADIPLNLSSSILDEIEAAKTSQIATAILNKVIDKKKKN